MNMTFRHASWALAWAVILPAFLLSASLWNELGRSAGVANSGSAGGRDSGLAQHQKPPEATLVELEFESGQHFADASQASRTPSPLQFDAPPVDVFTSHPADDSDFLPESLSDETSSDSTLADANPDDVMDARPNRGEASTIDALVEDAEPSTGLSAIPEAMDVSRIPSESPEFETDSAPDVTTPPPTEPMPESIVGPLEQDGAQGDSERRVGETRAENRLESFKPTDIAIEKPARELVATPSAPPTVFDLRGLDFQDPDSASTEKPLGTPPQPTQKRSARLASKFREVAKPAPGSNVWNVGRVKQTPFATKESSVAAHEAHAGKNPDGVAVKTYRPTGMTMDELVQIVGPVLKAARSGGVTAHATRSELAIVVIAPEEVHAAVDRLVSRFGDSAKEEDKEEEWSAELVVVRCAVNDPLQDGLSFNRLNAGGVARGYKSGFVSPLNLGQTGSLGETGSQIRTGTATDQIRVGVASASLRDVQRLLGELTSVELVARRRLALNPGQWVDVEATAAMAEHARGFGELYEEHAADFAGSGLKLKIRSRGVEGGLLRVDIQPQRGALAVDAAASNGDRLRIDSSLTARLSSGQTVLIGGVYSFEAFRVAGRRNVLNAVMQHDANGSVYRVQTEWIALLAVHSDRPSKASRGEQAATERNQPDGVSRRAHYLQSPAVRTTGTPSFNQPNLSAENVEPPVSVAALDASAEPEPMRLPVVSQAAKESATKSAVGNNPLPAPPVDESQTSKSSAKRIQIVPQKPVRKPPPPVIVPTPAKL